MIAMTSEMEYLNSQIEEEEHNIRLIEERKSEYPELQDIPLKLIKDEEKHRDRLKDLRRQREELQNATKSSKETLSLSAEEKVKKIYVDREEERRLFREMISGRTPIHILLMEAEKGMGKTILLDQFWQISEGFKRARVDFKDPSYTMGKILGEIRDQYGRQSFPIFHTECRSVLSQFGHDVTHNALICPAIDVRLTKISGDELRNYQRLITNAFLADLETIREKDQPVVMLFDNFQKASVSTKTWITELLIDEIRRYPWLVCVVTGRERPLIPASDSSWCLQHTLQPLSVEHRKEYIQKVKITQNEELVTFITKHSKGNPLILQQLVQTLLEE